MKRVVMRVLFVVVGVLFVCSVAVLLKGYFLPRDYMIERTVHVPVPADSVWALITDYDGQPAWRHNVKQVDELAMREGHPVWRELYVTGNAMTYVATVLEPPVHLVRTAGEMDGPFRGSWEFLLTPLPDGTQLSITERGTIPDPVFRVLYRYAIGPTVYLDSYLHAVAARFGTPAARVF